MIRVAIIALLLSGSFLIANSLGRRGNDLLRRIERNSHEVSWFEVEFGRIRHQVFRGFISRSRNHQVLRELPEVLDMLAVSLTSGESLIAALARVGSRANGVLPTELNNVFLAMELGSDFETELRNLAERIPNRQVREFSAKLTHGLNRGTPLADLVRDQAKSARAEIRNDLLRQAGRNETRMLIPLVFLILPITVVFAIYPSLQLLSINYT